MRRAAVSIPSNIAEGKGQSTDKDRGVFFCHARGSLLELETQIVIATQLGYLDGASGEKLLNLCGETGRMLNALIQSIKIPAKALEVLGLKSEVRGPQSAFTPCYNSLLSPAQNFRSQVDVSPVCC